MDVKCAFDNDEDRATTTTSLVYEYPIWTLEPALDVGASSVWKKYRGGSDGTTVVILPGLMVTAKAQLVHTDMLSHARDMYGNLGRDDKGAPLKFPRLVKTALQHPYTTIDASLGNSHKSTLETVPQYATTACTLIRNIEDSVQTVFR